MSITLEKLIELNDALHEILGWQGGGSLDISYNQDKVGDAWLYIDINDSVTGYDLLDTFAELYDKCLAKISEILDNFDYADDVHFTESGDENSNSGYVLAVKLLEGEG